MLCPELRLPAAEPAPPPSGCHWVELDALRFAQAVGELRASPALECQAHAQRLAASPVPHHGLAICSDSDGAVLACGQYAQEAELVGLYDVMTCESARRRGLATLLCERLLSRAVTDGADVAYLQMAADNDDARGVYRRLGFVDAYRYHYLQLP
jgi:GNAT superfamily N-acetyltransferase